MRKPIPYSITTGLLLLTINAGAQDNNIRLGIGAGANIQNSGASNVMIGSNAGYSTTSGLVNVMIGNGAGSNNTAGHYNTFIGNAAGAHNQGGSYNTCIGDGSGYLMTSSNNMMLGVHAGFNTTSGGDNVMIGFQCGTNNATGSQITLIGKHANVSANNLVNATAIGAGAIASVSNTVILGNNANIGIGTSNPQHKLSVNGTIGAREVRVTANGWADFVFTPTYRLSTLPAVEQYIKRHGHLPDIPSQTDVIKNGISVGDIQAKLLQKIEELTLYAINQQKEISQLKRRVDQLTHSRSTK